MSRKNYYFLKKSAQKFSEDVKTSIQRDIDECSSAPVQLPLMETRKGDSVNFTFDGTENGWNDDSSDLSCDTSNTDGETVYSKESISDDLDCSYHSLVDETISYTQDQEKLDCTETIQANSSLKESLREWAIENNITHVAINSLLNRMHSYHPELPLDARTLLQTKPFITEKVSDKSEFAYFGVEKALKCLLEKEASLLEKDLFDLIVHFDGIPITKSSSFSFWPILCRIHGSSILPFTIGIYYSDSKPDLHIYLEKFCCEMKDLINTGLQFNQKKYTIQIRAFIADAPAKSFIKQVKQHGGYYACTHCTVKGSYNKELKSMSYCQENACLRTDATFRNREQPQHHTGSSPLEQLDIDMVMSFPFDYMHLVLLGVMRKLLNIWLNKLPFKISSNAKKRMNDGLLNSKHFLPLEFHRKPRALHHIDRWKATEFRTFLLYLGCLFLKDNISENLYEHFMMLVCSIRVLCNPEMITDSELISYARKLVVCFVKRFRILYKNCSTPFNVHGLIHIADDVKKFGTLDSFSAFPFETFLGVLKSKLHSGYKPLSQICRRFSEIGQVVHKSKPKTVKNELIFVNDKTIVPGKFRDSCVLLHDHSVCLVMAVNGIKVTLKKFYKKSSLFTKPCNSSVMEIYKVEKNTKIIDGTVSDIKCKCFLHPIKSSYAIIPLL